MAISIQCGNPDCGKWLQVRESFAGKRVRCPACGEATPVDVPSAALAPMSRSETAVRAAAPSPRGKGAAPTSAGASRPRWLVAVAGVGAVGLLLAGGWLLLDGGEGAPPAHDAGPQVAGSAPATDGLSSSADPASQSSPANSLAGMQPAAEPVAESAVKPELIANAAPAPSAPVQNAPAPSATTAAAPVAVVAAPPARDLEVRKLPPLPVKPHPRDQVTLSPLPKAERVLSETDQLADLVVTHIGRTPRFLGYEAINGPEGVPVLVDNQLGTPLSAQDEALIERNPSEGDEVTFTAHVRNFGNIPSQGWKFRWLVDGKPLAAGEHQGSLAVDAEATKSITWKWQTGPHRVQFVLEPAAPAQEFATFNNAREIATDAWLMVWAIDQKVYDGFRQIPNLLGTRNFEDWVQWHVERMNELLAKSPGPGLPNGGCRARIVGDSILVVPDAAKPWREMLPMGENSPQDAGYDGAWQFRRDPKGNYAASNYAVWASGPDWGLIHEWGHQLCLTDEYNLTPQVGPKLLDKDGEPYPLDYDYGYEPYMMFTHSDTVFSPVCVAALDHQYGKRCGYFGAYYYCIPERCIYRVLDINGQPVEGAELEFYRAARLADFDGKPVFTGKTDAEGKFVMPNLPAPAVTTATGFTQHDNPFGNIDRIGTGMVFRVIIRARGQMEHTSLDIIKMNLAWFSGQKREAVFTHQRQIPPLGVPAAPASLVAVVEGSVARLSWTPVPGAVRYRLFFDGPRNEVPLAVGDDLTGTQAAVELTDGLQRFMVAAIDDQNQVSAFSPVVKTLRLYQPRGICIASDGRWLVRDEHYEQTVVFRPDGNIVGLIGSPHNHFNGSIDLDFDSEGQLLSSKRDYNKTSEGFVISRLVENGPGKFFCQPSGPEPGHFRSPAGITFGSGDRIFIADSGNDRVQIFSREGQFLRVLGDGLLKNPQKVAFTKDDSRMYIADHGNDRIAVFEFRKGAGLRFLEGWAFPKPIYVAVDDRGRVFATSGSQRQIAMFAADGKVAWRYEGEPNDRVQQPWGLALTPEGALVFTDPVASRVRVVRPPE